jgi:ankyrin repeat protein
MNLITELFELMKTHKYSEIVKILDETENIDLNIRDKNFNYLIQYAVIFNNKTLVSKLIDKGSNIDVVDIDGRTILYNPIKYNYIDILIILLEYNKKVLGKSIKDIKDINGYSPLHYSIIFKNYDTFKTLIEFGADIELIDNLGNTPLIIAVQYNRLQFIKYLVEKNVNLNHVNKEGESGVLIGLLKKRLHVVEFLLTQDINVNIYEKTNKISPLIIAINFGLNNIIQTLINKNIDIDHQDFDGNSGLHYIIIEANWYAFDLMIDKSNVNLINLYGKTPLHLIGELIDSYSEKSREIDIAKILIGKSKLNIQDMNGNTFIHMAVKKNLLKFFSEDIKKKKVNIFIKNNDNETPYDNKENREELMNIASESYYNHLSEDKLWINKWENECKIKLPNSRETCLKIIKKYIDGNKKSFPIGVNKKNLLLDNGIFVDRCSYVGVGIDLICGMLFLEDSFSILGTSLTKGFEINRDVEDYYESLGIKSSFKTDFLNFEILWIYQKLFYPSNFDIIIQKLLHDEFLYIIIPIGIEINTGSHANILFWDVKNNIIERFEPFGSQYPNNYYYNSDLLDLMLETKINGFKNGVKYINPSSYLPNPSFQSLESREDMLCSRIGDPNGFCAIWCIWWVYHRIMNIEVDGNKLALKLIKKIKLENFNFRDVIRNFTKNVTDIRDNILSKNNININDWINGRFTINQYDGVVDIIKKKII